MNPVDFLISIPGPVFLVYFIILSIVCIIAGRWLALNDGTGRYPMPDATALDYIEIAAMKGGRSAAVQAAVFDLWQKNLVGFPDEGRRVIESVPSDEKLPPSFQSVIYSFLKEKRRIAELFTSKEVSEALDVYLGSAFQKLEIMRLIQNKKDRIRVLSIFSVVSAMIFGTGFAKLYFGIRFGRPIAFLVVLIFMDFIAVMIVFRPFSRHRPTRHGKKYMAFLETHFSWLKQAVSKGEEIPSFNPALYGVAIFGIAFLSGMDLFNPFSSVFPADISDSGMTGGSDGGSSGGCSDGGGGCSGGGCGGCGGGD